VNCTPNTLPISRDLLIKPLMQLINATLGCSPLGAAKCRVALDLALNVPSGTI
jgi:hypothetical protein